MMAPSSSSPSHVSEHNNKPEHIRLIWHRRDLRLHDNELYANLVDSSSSSTGTTTRTISLFVFDQHYFHPQPSCITTAQSQQLDAIWCGPHAAQKLIQAVTSLRKNIQNLGGEFLIRSGDPAILVPQIAQEIGAHEIVYNEEPGSYECSISRKVQQRYMFQDDLKIISYVGYTLYHPNDLPFEPNEWDRLAHPKNKHKKKNKRKGNSIVQGQHSQVPGLEHLDLVDVSCERFKGMCRIMGDFRKAAKSAASVRKVLEPPKSLLKPMNFDSFGIDPGPIPTLEELFEVLLSSEENTLLGLDRETIDFVFKCAIEKRNESASQFECVESAALQRFEAFINEGYASSADRSLADVSNNNSSRLSVNFALGTLSPRTVYWRAHEAGEGTEWLMSHLEMRDFFLYTCFASGSRFYQRKGLPVSKKQEGIQWSNPNDKMEQWKRWATGKTQLPMVDAAIIELMTTGYCSNRVRQNVASVLTKDLGIDWRAGAEWFQFLLEDHCVGANFGNWLYFSGVGPDPKNRHFRTVSQAMRYDRDGDYVRKWLPALKNADEEEAAFRPWDFGIIGYESPVVDPKSQYTWQDLEHLKANGEGK